MYLRASEMSNQAWSEAVKTNNLEEHMLLDPLYYSFGDKEQKCWGVQVNVGGVQNMLGGGGGVHENIIFYQSKFIYNFHQEIINITFYYIHCVKIKKRNLITELL